MKSIMCFCMIDVLALLYTTASAENLLNNGGFEAEPTAAQPIPGWMPNAELEQQKLWLDTEQPHSGRRCVAIRSLRETEGEPFGVDPAPYNVICNQTSAPIPEPPEIVAVGGELLSNKVSRISSWLMVGLSSVAIIGGLALKKIKCARILG